ncbi:40S ribosomal protein S27-like [Mortierella sp. GBA35]|nr:40S ribosomal protein S27-like [Mortierella sp. AD031]KAF9097038.1 40S ribosomal protein S27-like [Mortierella sp. GBA35]KAG0203934.1 40S ribosomal protein S27-like [Mortierella sp. NVP41]
MTLAEDILNPSSAKEAQTHKLKRVVQSPDSFYMDVKCNGCQTISPLYSHADTVVNCPKCNNVLAQPTGGLAKLSEGVSFRKKPQ